MAKFVVSGFPPPLTPAKLALERKSELETLDRSFFAKNIAIRVFLDALLAEPDNETPNLMGFIKIRSI